MNVIHIIGRLGKDSEQRFTPQNTEVATFSVAVNDKFNKEHTDWFDVTAFGKLAEICNKWLKKGSQVAITGRINSSKYTGKDGIERTQWRITASDMEMLGGRETGGVGQNTNYASPQPEPITRPTQTTQQQTQTIAGTPPNPNDIGDIPF